MIIKDLGLLINKALAIIEGYTRCDYLREHLFTLIFLAVAYSYNFVKFLSIACLSMNFEEI